MAGWMLYTLLTTLLLVIAGGAAEQIARALRAPTRAVWACVIIAAMALTAAALLGRRVAPALVAVRAAASAERSTAHRAAATADKSDRGATLELERIGPASELQSRTRLTRLAEATVLKLDHSRWERYDATLSAICVSLATAGVLVVLLSFVRLRRMTRGLTRSEVDGTPVLLSHDLGPAVLGFLRLHVVIPRWVVALSSDQRHTILLHEQEHAAARDPMLVLLGVVALALQPWNLPLWIAVARLRFALEADCDARVLERCRCGVRLYGTLLLQVHEHELVSRMSSRMPVTAFVDSTSHLERRVRRMSDRQPRLRSLSTMAAFVATMLCAGLALSVQVSDARAVSRSLIPAPQEMRGASVPTPLAETPSRAAVASHLVMAPHWQVALPEVVRTERETPRADVQTAALAGRLVAPFEDRLDQVYHDEAFVSETLFVRASNPRWPIHARIISERSEGMAGVPVMDASGRFFPSADTLEINEPVLLIPPDARFALRVESLGGDLALTSSLLPPWDGQGGHVTSMVLSRTLLVRREAAGARVLLRGEGPVFISGKRVP